MSPPVVGVSTRKRKRSCERCIRLNIVCDADGESTCQNCITVGAGNNGLHIIPISSCFWYTNEFPVLLGCSTTIVPGVSLNPERAGMNQPPDERGLGVRPAVAGTPQSASGSLASRNSDFENRINTQTPPSARLPGPSPRQPPSIGSGAPHDFVAESSGMANGKSSTISTILSKFIEGSSDSQSPSGISPNDIPLHTAASFFHTYFTTVHLQYPFLDIETCAAHYRAWTRTGGSPEFVGWPAFFVNMVCILTSS